MIIRTLNARIPCYRVVAWGTEFDNPLRIWIQVDAGDRLRLNFDNVEEAQNAMQQFDSLMAEYLSPRMWVGGEDD